MRKTEAPPKPAALKPRGSPEAFNGKKHHQICESSEFVESTNALTRERQKFMLIYHVLDTKKACDRDREEALKGD